MKRKTEPKPAAPKPAISPGAKSIAGLAALALAVFGDLLLFPGDRVISRSGTDLHLVFASWREFGFGELAHGRLALWNPYLFCGAPFFGGFQSALLYPLNAIYLALPIAKALNLDAAVHTFLAGFFMRLWARGRGIGEGGAFLAAVIAMLSGASFLHLFPGHMTLVAAAAWAPLILMCGERLLEGASARWALIGMAAVAMQVLAGHPQTVFNTALAALVCLALGLAGKATRPARPARALASFAAMFAGGAALAAVQLLAGASAGAESTRGGSGFGYDGATFFSLPLENLLTLFAPHFFGGGDADPTLGPSYWGRGYAWEMTLYIGVAGLALAIYGAVLGERAHRRFCVASAALLLLLALGRHTPLYRLFYHLFPGFSRFRGPAKFGLEATLFLAMLAGAGFDRLLRDPRFRRPPAIAAVAAAALLLVGAIATAATGGKGWFASAVDAIAATGECYAPRNLPYRDAYLKRACGAAAGSLLLAALASAALGCAFWMLKIERRAARMVGVLAALELFVFARANRPSFPLGAALHPARMRELSAAPDAAAVRFFDASALSNEMLAARLHGFWGYDPQVSRRFAEFLRYTQGEVIDDPSMDVRFSSYNPIYRILRCGYVVRRSAGEATLAKAPSPLPRAFLAAEHEVLATREARLLALTAPGFDPSRKVLLEQEPAPKPERGGELGTATVADIDTDSFVVEADAPKAALLVITDMYSEGWRARALEGSAQRDYAVMPADHVLRAIPLAAGKHRILMEYSPPGYRAGKWISIAALLAYGAAWGAATRKPKADAKGAAADAKKA